MRFIKGFLATILASCFTLVLIGGLFVFVLNSFVKKNNIKEMVAEIGLENIPPFDDYVNINLEVDSVTMKDIMNIPEVKEIFSDYVGDAVQYMFYQKPFPQLTQDDINKILSASFLSDLNEVDKEKLQPYFDKFFTLINNDLKERITKIDINNYLGDSPIPFATFFAYNTKLIIIGILVSLSILIWVCRRGWYQGFAWMGSSITIASLVCLVVSLVLKAKLSEKSNIMNTVLFNNLYTKLTNYSFIVLIFGVLVLLLSFIFLRKSQLKTAEESANI